MTPKEAVMTEEQASPSGPDLTQGVAFADLVDGKLVGHVGKEEVLLLHTDSELFAIGAYCTHYHGPLAEGLVTGKAVRCPWHHACFDVRSGEALRAPALSPVESWIVEENAGRIFVKKKREQQEPQALPTTNCVGRIVIVGGGAAGFAAAEMLRRRGFNGSIVMLSHDVAPPVDRPNLSKDYLAGSAPEDWLPLRPREFYAENDIELHLGAEVVAIDANAHAVTVAGGKSWGYDRLLLATGAESVRLQIPGAGQLPVLTLRSHADCRAIITEAERARRAVVIGASFIGLEAAAALRSRNIEVHVVAPEQRPMERVLGPQMGDFVRALHEEHGVVFHLQDTVTAIAGGRAMLKSGGTLDADFAVMGVGVRPRLALAEQAGLALDRGVLVDAYLERASPASMRRATSRVGQTRIQITASAWSIGWLRSAKVKPQRPTC
jgi:nitrite reductase/ring-hydroxylating ferredoxin subunit/thioredoxin reductase